MQRPICSEKMSVGTQEFDRLGRRVAEGRFDGGSMTGDGGVMLLGQVDRKLGLMKLCKTHPKVWQRWACCRKLGDHETTQP